MNTYYYCVCVCVLLHALHWWFPTVCIISTFLNIAAILPLCQIDGGDFLTVLPQPNCLSAPGPPAVK